MNPMETLGMFNREKWGQSSLFTSLGFALITPIVVCALHCCECLRFEPGDGKVRKISFGSPLKQLENAYIKWACTQILSIPWKNWVCI